MKKIACFVGILVFLAAMLPAEMDLKKIEWSVRRSVLDQNTIEKPAQLLLQWFPKEALLWIVDGGISLKALPFKVKSTEWKGLAAVEYHRNDLKDKLQDALIATLGVSGTIGDKPILGTDNPHPIPEYPGDWKRGYTIMPQLAAKFKIDRVKKAQSLVASADVTAQFRKADMGTLGTLKNREDKLGFTWQPKIGVEFEQIVSAEDDAVSGHELRPFAAIEVAIYPFQGTKEIKRMDANGQPVFGWTKLGQRLQVWASYQYWLGLLRIGVYKENPASNRLLRVAVQYFLDSTKNFGIGVEYVNGSNPSENMPKRHYFQLSFCFKK